MFVVSDFLESRVLAFDVPGSHVAAAICCAPDFRLGPVATAPHADVATSGAFLDLLYELGMKARVDRDGIVGAMLAVPGPFDLQAGVSLMRHKLPYLYGVDLRQGLAERFGFEPLLRSAFSTTRTRICLARSAPERHVASAVPQD